MGSGGHLRQPVMDIAGYSAPLLFLGYQQLADEVPQLALAFGKLLIQPGVFQRARRLSGYTLKGVNRCLFGQIIEPVSLQYACDTVPD